ncbi:hypothetical protein AWC38_SpisGene22341 [Stylophora pistillata]|uniref:C3H1-type domain-containing protein n=1 Tax=Stylophora pistillata TaxID=50429 RepID=A0A2B4R9T5_STYPI|nr:hypothetical protein AWC38_SpisGene22341 [Stylophora pistillata]
MARNRYEVKLLEQISGFADDLRETFVSERTKYEVEKRLESEVTEADQLVIKSNAWKEEKRFGFTLDGKKLCLEYLTTASCQPPEGFCALWHICKGFIQGDCDGGCGRSHDFHDRENQAKTEEVGLKSLANELIKNIVAYRLPQVCLLYQNGKCNDPDECPFLHICVNALTNISCECALSHCFTDRRSGSILKRYSLSPSIWFKSERLIEFVRCNIIIPIEQVAIPARGSDALLLSQKEILSTSGCVVPDVQDHTRKLAALALDDARASCQNPSCSMKPSVCRTGMRSPLVYHNSVDRRRSLGCSSTLYDLNNNLDYGREIFPNSNNAGQKRAGPPQAHHCQQESHLSMPSTDSKILGLCQTFATSDDLDRALRASLCPDSTKKVDSSYPVCHTTQVESTESVLNDKKSTPELNASLGDALMRSTLKSKKKQIYKRRKKQTVHSSQGYQRSGASDKREQKRYRKYVICFSY